jgi:chromosomal replication initiation ATPase DnaA
MFHATKPDPKPCDGGCGTILPPIPGRARFEGQWMSPHTCTTCAEKRTPELATERVAANPRPKCAGHQNVTLRHLEPSGAYVTPTFPITPKRDQVAIADYLFECIYQPSSTGAYIYGPPGTGKTYLLKAMANSMRERGRDVTMLNDQELVTILRGTQKPGSALDVDDLLADLATVEVLILDDLNPTPGRVGADADEDFKLRHLYDIINRRLDANLATFVSSNVPLTAVTRVSPKIASRLGFKAWMRYFLVGGQDLRAA